MFFFFPFPFPNLYPIFDPFSSRHKAVVEIRKLRCQLTNEINLIIPSCDLFLDPDMTPPNEEQVSRGSLTWGILGPLLPLPAHISFHVSSPLPRPILHPAPHNPHPTLFSL